ncbi:MAG: MFS transporter [Methylococcales bacterium]|nr:MFS transporter [Methylococcales bacterium]
MTNIQDITSPITSLEKRAISTLAGVYALRMLGLFMILPVLSLFAKELDGATPALIGLAMSIYGLPQVVLQIPFGLMSDKFGRKKLIIIGLVLFFAGSVVAASSNDIYGVLIGRALQGVGAISAVIMALVADLTQEIHRTKAMATIGISIGMSFGAGIVAGPIIAAMFGGIHGVFWTTAFLTLLAIATVIYIVPNPEKSKLHRDAEFVPADAMAALKNPELLRLDYGIFILHLILMAIFVVVPTLMRDAGLEKGTEWQVYLPVFVISMALIVPFIILAEKKRQMKKVFLGAIVTLSIAAIGFAFLHENLVTLIVFLSVFFCGFNLLEATLPSLVSKTAPADLKGTAMGAYSSSQFLGLFCGGLVGGWFNGQFGVTAVFLVCAALALSWFWVSFFMKEPRYLASLLISIEAMSEGDAKEFVKKVLNVTGIEEAILHHEEAVLYLKVDNQLLDKAQLQTLVNEYIHAYQHVI